MRLRAGVLAVALAALAGCTQYTDRTSPCVPGAPAETTRDFGGPAPLAAAGEGLDIAASPSAAPAKTCPWEDV